jgi:hypothetical protein
VFDRFDPRDRDDDRREIDVHWVELERARSSSRRPDDDIRDRDEDPRGRDRDRGERHLDPRDVFDAGLDLPRDRDREVVLDGDFRYELNRDDSRALATIATRSARIWRCVGRLHGPSRSLPDTRTCRRRSATCT